MPPLGVGRLCRALVRRLCRASPSLCRGALAWAALVAVASLRPGCPPGSRWSPLRAVALALGPPAAAPWAAASAAAFRRFVAAAFFWGWRPLGAWGAFRAGRDTRSLLVAHRFATGFYDVVVHANRCALAYAAMTPPIEQNGRLFYSILNLENIEGVAPFSWWI